jgi:hypothetical protein
MGNFPDMEYKPEAAQQIGEVEDAYDLHRQVYRNPALPLALRLRSATVALEYERPRLAVTAVINNEEEFAARLEQAVRRSALARQQGPQALPAPTIIDHSATARE